MKTLLRTAALVAVLTTSAAGASPALSAVPGADPAAASAFAATTLNLSAYGEARADPDMATISLGVETAGPTAAAAMQANAAQMSKVVAALKKAGIADRDLQTANLSLSPQYVYEQNQPPRLTGYQASNQLSVTVKDLSKLASVVDATVSAGATNVGQISFGLSNPVAAENTARIAAVKALQDKASLYANATGYRISRLVNLDEGGGYSVEPPRPMMAVGFAAKAAPTPVETGTVKVRVDITGVFELTH
ncbi:MAG TPA: SIMPL domain-containing protein [Caulobacteraceae bacterium]